MEGQPVSASSSARFSRIGRRREAFRFVSAVFFVARFFFSSPARTFSSGHRQQDRIPQRRRFFFFGDGLVFTQTFFFACHVTCDLLLWLVWPGDSFSFFLDFFFIFFFSVASSEGGGGVDSLRWRNSSERLRNGTRARRAKSDRHAAPATDFRPPTPCTISSTGRDRCASRKRIRKFPQKKYLKKQR